MSHVSKTAEETVTSKWQHLVNVKAQEKHEYLFDSHKGDSYITAVTVCL